MIAAIAVFILSIALAIVAQFFFEKNKSKVTIIAVVVAIACIIVIIIDKVNKPLDIYTFSESSTNSAVSSSKKEKDYADQYVQKAEDAFFIGDINSAIGNMEAAIEINPIAEYQTKLEEYKLYMPLKLYEEKNSFYKDYKINFSDQYRDEKEFQTAINQTKYENLLGVRYNTDDPPAIVKYFLGGKYNYIKGVFFSPIINASSHYTGTAHFEAYGDGKLLYTSPELNSESLPVDIKFSVNDIQKLEIRIVGSGSSVWGVDEGMGYGDFVMFSNLIAYKEIPERD